MDATAAARRPVTCLVETPGGAGTLRGLVYDADRRAFVLLGFPLVAGPGGWEDDLTRLAEAERPVDVIGVAEAFGVSEAQARALMQQAESSAVHG